MTPARVTAIAAAGGLAAALGWLLWIEPPPAPPERPVGQRALRAPDPPPQPAGHTTTPEPPRPRRATAPPAPASRAGKPAPRVSAQSDTATARPAAPSDDRLTAQLRRWRAPGAHATDDRAVETALATLPPSEVERAAIAALFDPDTAPETSRALLALLASLGTENATKALLAACEQPALRAPALRALATVSDPQALGVLARRAEHTTDRALLGAIAAAARGMDGAKAAGLRARIAKRLADDRDD
ncbi:MAG: hypothetical protein D6776_02150 [Planctomycetota bacterium]|nr:MAG: hypothetical protein D6776_02150 [Planctomycetota bacterium]